MRLEDEKDIEQLRTKALVLARENERLSKKMVELFKENLSLKGMTAAQLQQVLVELDEQLNRVKADEEARTGSTERRGTGAKPQEKKPQVGHGPTPQPTLAVVREEHDMDEADKVCGECGGQLCWWEGQDDETEEVEVVERRFVIKKNVRKKYRCKCGCVEMAPMPPRLIPGGRYSNDFAIEVAIGKYVDHLPLERQVRIMEREGLEVSSQTLWDQLEALAKKLNPAYERLRAEAILSAVLGFDETRWEVLTKGSASQKSWTMWQLSTWRSAYYAIAPDHDTKEGNAFLEGFTGIAVGDAAAVHKKMARTSSYQLAFCWAHCRRRFLAAEQSEPIRVKQVIDFIAEMYAVEAQAPPGPPGDELRKKLRNEQTRPIVKKLEDWLLEQRFLPESDLGKAIKYARNNWKGLQVFLDEPQVPIDNNRTERGFRGPVIGRVNHYGSKSKRGTEVAALFYSLLESAKMNDVDPRKYLRAALAAALDGRTVPLPHEPT